MSHNIWKRALAQFTPGPAIVFYPLLLLPFILINFMDKCCAWTAAYKLSFRVVNEISESMSFDFECALHLLMLKIQVPNYLRDWSTYGNSFDFFPEGCLQHRPPLLLPFIHCSFLARDGNQKSLWSTWEMHTLPLSPPYLSLTHSLSSAVWYLWAHNCRWY